MEPRDLAKGRASDKLSWRGKLTSVQPRIRLLRSFDQRSHSYLGYVLRVEGMVGNEEREFLVGIGKGVQSKHMFCAGDMVSGLCQPVEDDRMEAVEFYKASGLKVVERAEEREDQAPPWIGVPADLETYRARGHRRLDAHTYDARCRSCIWGCRMAVEMIIDQWKPNQRRYRDETFCYGPKSCALYRAGPTRKVPGRKGMVWEEEDWEMRMLWRIGGWMNKLISCRNGGTATGCTAKEKYNEAVPIVVCCSALRRGIR